MPNNLPASPLLPPPALPGLPAVRGLLGAAKPKAPRTMLWIVLAFAAVYLVWGSTYMGIVVALEGGMPPFLMAGVRFLLAGGVLLAVARARNGAPLPWTRRQVLHLALLGFLFFVLGNGLVVYAEQYVASGIAALLIVSEPIWVELFDGIRTRRVPRWPVWVGLALGLCGVAVLVGERALTGLGEGIHVWGALAVLVAAMGWAGATVHSVKAPLPAMPLQRAGAQMLFGGGFMVLLALATGEARGLDVGAITTEAWLAWGYLVVFGSGVAFLAFSYLMQHVKPSLVATSSYVNPLVAVLLGWLVLDEALGLNTAAAAALMLLGVGLVGWGQVPTRKKEGRGAKKFARLRRVAVRRKDERKPPRLAQPQSVLAEGGE